MSKIQIDSVSFSPDSALNVFKIGTDFVVRWGSGVPNPTCYLEPFIWNGIKFIRSKSSQLASDAHVGDDHVTLVSGEASKFVGCTEVRITDDNGLSEIRGVGDIIDDDVFFTMSLANNYLVSKRARIESVCFCSTPACAYSFGTKILTGRSGNVVSVDVFTYDGFLITKTKSIGLGGLGPGSSCLSLTSDGTYGFCTAYYQVYNPPPNKVWKNRIHALNLTGGSSIAYLDGYTGSLIYQGGAIFNIYYGGIKKLTFDGSSFTLVTTVANSDIFEMYGHSGDGTYLYVIHADGHSILVYDNNLNLVTTFDTGLSVIGEISCSANRIYVAFSSPYTRIYVFNGSNFTTIDSVDGKAIGSVVQ